MPSLRVLCTLLVSRLREKSTSRSEIPEIPEIPEPNTLAGLPTELFLSIADFLPPVDLVCFSLCSRRLFAVFRRQNNSLLQLKRRKKLPLLNRLERDLPKYFICYACFLLHKYNGSERFNLSGSLSELACPLRCFPDYSPSLQMQGQDWHIWYRFYFLHLQLAMRRFYYGPQSGISTECISYTQARPHPKESAHPEITSLFSIDAQICPQPPSLYLRIQNIMLVRDQRLDLRPGSRSWGDPPLVWIICRHCSTPELANLINPTVNAYSDGKKAPSSTYTCDRCGTDSQVEICEYGSDLALVLTKWINLGPGLTPYDSRWRVHSRACDAGDITLDPSDIKASPARICFENVSPRSLAALRSCNLSYLKDQRYKQVMRQTLPGGHIWHLPRKA